MSQLEDPVQRLRLFHHQALNWLKDPHVVPVMGGEAVIEGGGDGVGVTWVEEPLPLPIRNGVSSCKKVTS